MLDVAANLAEIEARIEEAARRGGREPGTTELMVVSKTWPAEILRKVVEAGHRLFGENKVQEVCAKAPEMSPDLRWHFIGHLQRNKVRKVLSHVEAIHSVDSLKLARYTDRIAGELGLRPEAYLEVNIGGEENKYGFSPEGLREEFGKLAELEHLRVAGLMCIPPAEQDPERARRWFAALRELKEELSGRGGGPDLPGLSMGMSHDYEVAIEEGATIVRVGSAVFGPRNKTGGTGA